MILTSIVPENKMLFSGLVPAHILDCIGREYRFGLGLIGEVEDDAEAAGALIFDVFEDSVNTENIVEAWIQWIYVDGRYRQKGVAGRLITELYAVLESAQAAFIYVDIPRHEGYDLLCDYLEECGFAFHVEDKYEFVITLEEIRNTERMPKKLMEGIYPLAEVSAVQFKAYLSAMRKSEEIMDGRITWEKGDYEEQVSCCYVKDGTIKGALLIQKVNNKYIEVLHMRTLENDSGVLMGMMAHSVAYSKAQYEDDTYVNIQFRSQNTGKVIGYLFPEYEPLLVRRGIKSLKKKEE